VIPLFRKQLAAGGPLTVTHPDVTRYFMTIPEAVQLVLQAAALPEAAGRITMLEMGEPVRIVELAENLLRLSGIEPYTEMPIVFSGLRPGEKLYEELMTDVEETVPTSVEKIRVVQTDETDGHAPEGDGPARGGGGDRRRGRAGLRGLRLRAGVRLAAGRSLRSGGAAERMRRS
jgi:FlaA1/EpsC-like NDP-sugar epimerase